MLCIRLWYVQTWVSAFPIYRAKKKETDWSLNVVLGGHDGSTHRRLRMYLVTEGPSKGPWIQFLRAKLLMQLADTGFPRNGGTNLKEGYQPIILANIPIKLHENGQRWTERRERAILVPPQDLPMKTAMLSCGNKANQGVLSRAQEALWVLVFTSTFFHIPQTFISFLTFMYDCILYI